MNENTPDKVIKLVPRGALSANQNLITMLKDLLKMAEEGKIISAAMVAETVDDSTVTVVSSEYTAHLILAGLTLLQWKICKGISTPVPFPMDEN